MDHEGDQDYVEAQMNERHARLTIIFIIGIVVSLLWAMVAVSCIRYHNGTQARALESSGYWDEINRGHGMYDATGDRSTDTED